MIYVLTDAYAYSLLHKFEHAYGHAVNNAEVGARWERVDQASVLVAIEQFEAQRDRVCDPGTYWACSLCPSFDSFGKGMKQHLESRYVPSFLLPMYFGVLTPMVCIGIVSQIPTKPFATARYMLIH